MFWQFQKTQTAIPSSISKGVDLVFLGFSRTFFLNRMSEKNLIIWHRSVRTAKIGGKRAATAFGNAAAMCFAHGHGEGVKLIEELRVR